METVKEIPVIAKKVEVNILPSDAKVVGYIYETREYDSILRVEENRDLDNKHIKRLERRIAKKYIPTFIHTCVKKGKLVRKDGEHRSAALKNLGLPIFFFVEGGKQTDGEILSDIQGIQGSKPWKPINFIKSTAKNEKHPNHIYYKTLLSLIEEYDYKFAPSTIWALMGTGQESKGTLRFTDGTFTITPKQEVQVKKYCSMLADFGDKISFYGDRVFATAFIQIANTPKYDHSIMCSKIDRFKKIAGASVQECFKEFARVYNHFNRNKLKFTFICKM